ncbi:MAG: chromosomal replication initiator protein DnaA [Pseudomonadota bacterium]
MELTLWEECKTELRRTMSQLTYTQLITPLQAELTPEGIRLWVPNSYVKKDIIQYCMGDIGRILYSVSNGQLKRVLLEVGALKVPGGSMPPKAAATSPMLQAALGSNLLQHSVTDVCVPEYQPRQTPNPPIPDNPPPERPRTALAGFSREQPVSADIAETIAALPFFQHSNLNPQFTFPSFVVGKANQLAQAAAQQIARNPGGSYNPFFLYGGVGLGKTHLMHAIGNAIVANSGGKARVAYLHSERFVADMVSALQNNSIDKFKQYYRSMDALLVDDIQFIGNKERTQEEFFHTFNALLEGGQQVILTSDRYPKEIAGLEERLRSRFGSGLTVAIEPPELETRVAILLSKAEQINIDISSDVAFFIAKRVRSNVRELEGALKRVVANAQFTGQSITMDFVQDALKDVLALQAKLVSIDNIMKVVADRYNLRVADLLSKKRTRIISRPRQMAMHLCKVMTAHSLPEIGDAFGGRDHTTVLHACRTIKDLLETDTKMKEDFNFLSRILSD